VKPLEKAVAYFFYYILPNLEKFNIKNAVVMKTELDSYLIANTIIYGFCYTSALLILAILIFNKREFQ
jgi:hypothetical protein